MPSSLFPPAILHFRVETTASVEAIDAVLEEIASDAPRAVEIRHVKIDPSVWVSASHGDLVLESRGVPNGIPVRAVVALDAHQAGAPLVGEIFRPGSHAVLAALGGAMLFVVWQALTGFWFLLIALPFLAWVAIKATRIDGYNRGRAELLIQTATHVARLAEAMPPSELATAQANERAAREGRRPASWFTRVGGGTIVGWSVACGYFAMQSFRLDRGAGLGEMPERVGGGMLFGALMGRVWYATRDWSFLGRWTAVLRGVLAGGTSAWLIADLRIPIGTLRSWQIVSVGLAAGVLIGLWSESSEAPAE